MKIVDTAIAATGLFLAVSLMPVTASSQAICMPRADMVSALAGSYKESLIGKGLIDRTTVAEVFTTANGSTFSILITRTRRGPDGAVLESCLVAEGHDWLIFTPAVDGDVGG